MNLKNYNTVLSDCSKHEATLVAVSKTRSNDEILEMYNAGQLDFGENRVQELLEKYNSLPTDIKWHQIGHLQRNKVKDIIPFVSLIHSIDSFRLLKEVNKQAKALDKIQDILIQFHIAEESSKYGFDIDEVTQILASDEWQGFKHIRTCGVMGMATFSEDKTQVRQEFKQLKSHFDLLKSSHFTSEQHFNVVSMGMSGDYKISIEEGSTMVRVGSLLFN